ncbi:MAG: alpha/beta hydrolase [Actinobacteria bacterium]|nr:alpha/beta hydrolase [Actinomycetota bacterium]
MVDSKRIQMSDGAEVVVHDFGGDGPVLLFGHGTGLCAAMWGPVIDQLGGSFHAMAIDSRGHGLSPTPVSGNMARTRLAADVLEVVDACDLRSESTIAVGHSSGAHSLLAAAGGRPGCFSTLLAFEPMFAPPTDGDSAERQERLQATVESTRRRRAHWESRDEARDYFSQRGPMARTAPEVLDAFIEQGVVPDPAGGVRLACAPADEAAIYASAIEHSDASLAAIACPVRFAYGELNAVAGGSSVRALAERIGDAAVTELEGMAHFGPFENPALFGSWVGKTLSAI